MTMQRLLTILVAVVGLLTGCATPPLPTDRVESQALTDTAQTRLGQAVAPRLAQHPGLSGLMPFEDPHDAFAARVLLSRLAERSLDVQYFIWHGDAVGTLLWQAMWQAAERGVRVRLLIDDANNAGLDPVLAVLDAHPHIELRLYNPFVNRGSRAIGYLTDFSRLNRRMLGRHDIALEDVAQQVSDRRRVQCGAERPRVQQEPGLAAIDREQLKKQGRHREQERDHERQLGASDRGDRCNDHEEIGDIEHDPSARRGLEQQHHHDERQHRDEKVEAALEEHLCECRACAVDCHVSPRPEPGPMLEPTERLRAGAAHGGRALHRSAPQLLLVHLDRLRALDQLLAINHERWHAIDAEALPPAHRRTHFFGMCATA